MIYAKQTILGQPPSKSNSYKIIMNKGHSSLGKTEATKKYEMDFFMQCTLRKKGICKRFKLTVDVFFASDRPDLDNAMKVLLDCLQTCGAIKNDRLCAEIHARKLIDKKNPRIEFWLEELL
ncbi:MAG: RusA family crossover junction endodeoxyribonuclease [Clostridia bacterium]|nr:RusA family crossover junction endodeoxyribonuclease [Clostridia bacterium]